MNEWGWRVEIEGGRGTGTCFGAGVMRVADLVSCGGGRDSPKIPAQKRVAKASIA